MWWVAGGESEANSMESLHRNYKLLLICLIYSTHHHLHMWCHGAMLEERHARAERTNVDELKVVPRFRMICQNYQYTLLPHLQGEEGGWNWPGHTMATYGGSCKNGQNEEIIYFPPTPRCSF